METKMKRLYRPSDFKKGQTVYFVEAWNCHLGFDMTHKFYSVQIDEDKTEATFNVRKLTVLSSGKKQIKFLDVDGNPVKWQDYFNSVELEWGQKSTFNLYYSTPGEAAECIKNLPMSQWRKDAPPVEVPKKILTIE